MVFYVYIKFASFDAALWNSLRAYMQSSSLLSAEKRFVHRGAEACRVISIYATEKPNGPMCVEDDDSPICQTPQELGRTYDKYILVFAVTM